MSAPFAAIAKKIWEAPMRKLFLSLILIFVSLVGNAQETTNHSDLSFANTLLVASSITLGVVYAVTIYADATTGGRIDFYENFIPGIGPLIAYARYDSVVSTSYSSSSGRETQKTLLALSGVIQSASIVGIVYAMIVMKNSEKESQKSGLSFEPYGISGMKLVYRY
jgi:hypothetical protein